MRAFTCILVLSALSYGQSPVQGTGIVNGSGSFFDFTINSIIVTPLTSSATVGTNPAFTASFTGPIKDPDGVPYSAPACGSSGWASSSPSIATIDASTGIASAVAVGSTTISCTASSLVGNATLFVVSAPNFTNPALPCGPPCALANGTVNQSYSYTMTAAGGVSPYIFSLTAGALPSGLNLSTSGGITGVPTTAVTSTFSVQVCDSVGGCTSSLQVSITINASGNTPALPATWVDASIDPMAGELHHVIYTPDFTITFPSSGTGGSWTCGVTNYGPYTAWSQASLNQALLDAESCRVAQNKDVKIIAPHNAGIATNIFTGNSSIVLPQTLGDTSTKYIALTSDTPLPTGRTACSHGIQDNCSSLSTDILIRNNGCNGALMSYQCGTTITPINYSLSTLVSTGATPFTRADGVMTNTSAYNDVASMFTLECSQTNCTTLTTAADSSGLTSHHFAILNAEIRPKAGIGSSAIVKIGTQAETSAGNLANHLHLAYYYIHADITDALVSGGVAIGAPTGGNTVPNGIAFNCQTCSASYGYMDRILRPGNEGHGIYLGLWNQIKLAHDVTEGQSVAIFAGGFSNTTPFSGFGNDLEIRSFRNTYPYSWMLAAAANLCVNGLSCNGHNYVQKNRLELKICSRCLIDGWILENSDNSGAQSGILASWKTDNNSINSGATNYWISNQNLTVTNGVGRNSCESLSWGFRASYLAGGGGGTNGGGVTGPISNALFQNNLIYNVGTSGVRCNGANAQGTRINNNGGNTWTVTSATRDSTGTIETLVLHSESGLTQSNMNVGDPGRVISCADTSFNTPTTSLTFALTGTTPTGLTVVLPNTGTANATTTGCVFSNQQGQPNFLTYNHNSEFINGTGISPFATGSNAFPQLSRNMVFTNSVMVGGGINGGWSEGTRTETKSFDATTEIVHDILFPGRDPLVVCPGHTSPGPGGMPVCYTQYSDTSVASVPTTVYGVPTSYCTTNDPTAGSCSGIFGAMSQSSFPATLSDWHNYRLCKSTDASCNNKASNFAAGGPNQAADGTDLGVNFTNIDAAQTSTQYPGGFPDH